MIDVVTLGEALIDMVSLQRNVGLFETPGFKPEPGGAPANVAVGLARLGASVAFVGKVGRDEFGIGLRRVLEREHVDISCLIDDQDAMTTLAFVSLETDGTPHFAFFAGAHTHLTEADVNQNPIASMISSARIFHFGSVAMAHEPSRSATFAALKLARAHGVLCSYDINWRPALWPDAPSGLKIALAPLPEVDIFKMNGGELKLITGESDPIKGLEKLDIPAPLVIVTLAEQGCTYRYNGRIDTQPAYPIEAVIDGTGAGDSFVAALLADLRFPVEPDHLAAIVRRANKAGAITASRMGAIPSMPYRRELD
jgi:fructokinase